MNVLVKYLSEVSHAQSFIDGNMIFTNLAEYILTEDITRKDIEEGYFDENFDDDVESFCVKINAESKDINSFNYIRDPKQFFVICLSEDDNLFKKFNSSVAVLINNPEEFSKKISENLNNLSNNELTLGQGPIEYYDKETSFRKKGIINSAYPLFKNNKFEEEREYRYFFHKKNLFITDNRNKKNGIIYDLLIYRIKINIGSISDICTLIYDQ